MKTSRKKVVNCLIFLMLMAGITSSYLGGILCIGDNGHINIEFVSQQCCEETVESGLLMASDLGHERQSICGSCYDISLDSPRLLNRNPVSVFTAGCVYCLPLASFANEFDTNISYKSFRSTNYFQSDFRQSLAIISSTIIIC